jgi:hypothetical protein
MTDRNEGCLTAFVGCAIAVISVAGCLWGALGAATEEHWGRMQAYLVLTFVGAIVGFFVFIVGIAKAISGETGQAGSPDRVEKRPAEENLCQNCGCRVADGSKTCRWCGDEKE